MIHHTNCGMELFTDKIIRDLLANSLDTAKVDASGWHDISKGPGSRHGELTDWLPIEGQSESVVTDVERIRNHPLVPSEIPISGDVYQADTGALIEVAKATDLGRAR